MNKKEMANALAEYTGFTKKDSEIALNAIFKIISDTLASGNKIQIVGFGVFEVKERAPRMGRNPKSNEPISIPAQRVPYFTPGKILKSLVGVESDLQSNAIIK